MKMRQGARRCLPLLVGVALAGAGVALSGCQTVGGGESGNKYGPFNTDPKAKPGKGKFKGYARCASLGGASDVMIAFSSAGTMLAYAPPAGEQPPIWPQNPAGETVAPTPEIQVAGSSGGSSGGDRRLDCLEESYSDNVTPNDG